MHELSVCQALVAQLERVSATNGGGRVELVRLRVGPLSGIEPALLRHAFPLAAAGTVADGADLFIESSTLVVQCSGCGVQSEAAANRMLCGSCGSFRVRLISGDEMMLESVELAVVPVARAAML